MAHGGIDQRIAAVRRFNRAYTPVIGLLNDGYLNSPFSLTEVRILYELAHREKTTAAELGKALRLDAGYLSRILQGFAKRNLIQRRASKADGRENILSLTQRGRQVFGPLEQRSHAQIGSLLGNLSPADQRSMVESMSVIERLISSPATTTAREPYVLRPPASGDFGWVVERHGVLYQQEYGWNEQFEGLVAGIVSSFIKNYDPKRERCWIAERAGDRVGCLFLVKESDTIARLRLMLVEPSARGLGIGKRLVDECLRFARSAGYRKIVLWTNDVLAAARHIYEKAGFRLVEQEAHRSFGHDLIGETWELELH